MRAVLIGLGLAVALAIPGGGNAVEKYVITHDVWGWYQQYLRNIDNGTKPGAFAITKDGLGAFYSWCQDIRCVAGTTYSHDAVTHCERSSGMECVVFAVRDKIKVDYQIYGAGSAGSSSVTQAAATPPPAPEPAPALAPEPTPAPEATTKAAPAPAVVPAPVPAQPKPALKISITARVQERIDVYLRNVQSAGRVWAFAVSKDGTESGTANCPPAGSFSGGRSCWPATGSTEDLVKREAIARCGGPSECILLYAGAQKQGNIEIVAP